MREREGATGSSRARELVELARQRMPGTVFEGDAPMLSQESALEFITAYLMSKGHPGDHGAPLPVTDLPSAFSFTAWWLLYTSGEDPATYALDEIGTDLGNAFAANPGPAAILAELRMLCMRISVLPELLDIPAEHWPL
ncbi:hypothetical protein ACIQC7_34830 [Kitasatospora sp. NPDC088556]|uniref:hypothetical protein n=1 Tax=Kitasatospora sp. NPDC088556 TaxID=3364076 RepID=UPI00381775B6